MEIWNTGDIEQLVEERPQDLIVLFEGYPYKWWIRGDMPAHCFKNPMEALEWARTHEFEWGTNNYCCIGGANYDCWLYAIEDYSGCQDTFVWNHGQKTEIAYAWKDKERAYKLILDAMGDAALAILDDNGDHVTFGDGEWAYMD